MCLVPLTGPPNEQKPSLTPGSAVDDCRGQSLLPHPQELVAAAHDETFGSAIQGYRGDCDFTVKFKRVLFAIIPATIFIAACLPRIMYLLQSTTAVGHCFLRYVKLVCHVMVTFSPSCFNLSQQVLLILWPGYNRRICHSLSVSPHSQLREVHQVQGIICLVVGSTVCFRRLCDAPLVTGTCAID